MRYPPKPRPGDRVAILSPSWGGPARFPEVYELGLMRLRDELGLVAVEYPTTRASAASAADRAADIHAAFADPTITAVMASIGGDDQITVLRHLDVGLLSANPKPFFGYSDNTNLLNFLFNAGVVGYHGGSVMVHLGRNGGTNPDSMASLRAALFSHGWFDLAPARRWTDEPGTDWNDPATLANAPAMFEGSGWTWHNAEQVVEGRSWGGNIEIMSWLLQVGRDIRPAGDYAGHVLFVETSEDMPSADDVYYTLRSMGERGLLAQFPAVLVARPKAWEHSRPNSPAQKRDYADRQRAAVLRAFGEYAPTAMIVFDVDFGHTDPQLIIPYGGDIRVNGRTQTISVHY
jgi:muramoyltetrapeptide carboxypeptidase LdcA involved in peptidoglycan recycling